MDAYHVSSKSPSPGSLASHLTLFSRKHTRCDLRRPSCYKCMLADRECTYDSTRPRSLSEANISTSPPPSNSLYNDVVHNDIHDPRQQRALAHYMDRTRKELAGFTSFTDRFWNVLIPHLSITEPTFRHLAITIATRHEITLTAKENTEDLYEFCSQEHCLTLELFSKLDAARHADLLLLSCIAFIAFERLTDPTGMEARYLPYVMAGLKILGERRRAPLRQNSFSSSSLIESFIEPMFLQIELMFCIFCPPSRILGNEVENTPMARPVIPACFSSIKDARNLFAQICVWRYHISMTALPWDKYSEAFQSIWSLIGEWNQAFAAYIVTGASENSKIAAMRHQVCLLIGAMLYSVEEAALAGTDTCCYPTLVDLRTSTKMQIYVRIPADRRINLTTINGSRICDAADVEARLLPRAKRVPGVGADDCVLLEFMR